MPVEHIPEDITGDTTVASVGGATGSAMDTEAPVDGDAAGRSAEAGGAEDVCILLVDDQPNNLLVLEALLEGEGRRLVRAGSGREALRRMLERDFAVILLDVQMAGLDGFETAELIRQRERSASTPIIFLTASDGGHKFAARGYAVGAVDYLPKPIDPDVLRSKVAVFVDLYRMSAQVKRQAAQLAQQAHMDGILLAARTFEHELNTKLASTIGYAQLVLKDSALPEHLRERTARALAGAQEAAEIIRRLLGMMDVQVIDWADSGHTTIDVRENGSLGSGTAGTAGTANVQPAVSEATQETAPAQKRRNRAARKGQRDPGAAA